jgi:hypothetical protein
MMYEAECCLMSDIRQNRTNGRRWKQDIDADYNRRGKR